MPSSQKCSISWWGLVSSNWLVARQVRNQNQSQHSELDLYLLNSDCSVENYQCQSSVNWACQWPSFALVVACSHPLRIPFRSHQSHDLMVQMISEHLRHLHWMVIMLVEGPNPLLHHSNSSIPRCETSLVMHHLYHFLEKDQLPYSFLTCWLKPVATVKVVAFAEIHLPWQTWLAQEVPGLGFQGLTTSSS